MHISLVVCTHNGAARLPETLRHLARQKLPASVSAEVIVVDNASTDDTDRVARSSWSAESAIPLRIAREDSLGLSFARVRGWKEARAELVAFIDDDNWLPEHWAHTAVEIMQAHPEVAACGGPAEPVFEIEPPFWFVRYAENFATGSQSEYNGDVTDTRPVLWGAGLTVRKRDLQLLESAGHATLGSDRRGQQLTAGGDTELCFALTRMGGRLWYDDRLKLRHFIPAGRLRWEYVRRLYRGFGAATVVGDFYRFETFLRSGPLLNAIRTFWLYRLLRNVAGLPTRPRSLWHWLTGREGSHDGLWVDEQLGRISELARQRGRYARGFRRLSQIQWPRR
jgi:glycosyltransferase involved in cell wall biosynthesis